MINLSSLAKIALPIVESILTESISTGTSPKKQENNYAEIAPRAIYTIIKSLNTDNQKNNNTTLSPMINNCEQCSPYEIARNKKYKYNF